MCGLYGIVGVDRDRGDDRRMAMASMALKHRGPDGHGELELQVGRTKMVLGHRRLAIIDLSEAGRQPMESTCGRWAIVFNGEIYNYRELRADLQRAGIAFRSDSDTEVLLACWAHWGEACLPRLVGMFAFAIVDRAERSLTLVRDAFGIKPLFYACDGGRLSFASELVAMATLHGLAPDVDVRTAHRFLRWGECDLGFSTFIRGASQLPPAMLAQFRLEDRELRPSLRRWWNPCLDEDDSVTFADAAERFRALFLESVRLHLRSDVPVGISLSGGIDSASIACVVRMLEPEADIHTFTYVADSRGGAVNEEGPADLVNRQIRAHSHKIHISTSDLDRDLEDLVRAQGEPFVSGTMYAQYCVFREARRSGIIVMLEGQGADELLGGYAGYPAARFRSYVDRLQLIDAVRFGHGARHWPGCQRFRPWRSLLREAAPDFIDRMFLRLSGRGRSPGWISEDAMSEFALVPWHQPIPPWKRQSGRRLAETLLAELTCTGVPRLMRDGDRNAMRFSVENRVPFLSLPLAESVLRLPESFLVSDRGETKRILRAAMRGIVPDEILDQRDKVAYRTPQGDWLRGRVLQDLQSGRYPLPEGSLLNLEAAIDAIRSGSLGGPGESQLAWRLFSFLAWHRFVLSRWGRRTARGVIAQSRDRSPAIHPLR